VPGVEHSVRVGKPAGPIIQRRMRVALIWRAARPASPTTAGADSATDPMTSWATRTLAGNTLGGLIMKIEEAEGEEPAVTWEYEQGEKLFARATQLFDVYYATSIIDAEPPGGGGPAPIVRIAKGSANDWAFDAGNVVTIPNVSLAPGSTLVVFVCANHTFATTVKWGATDLSIAKERIFISDPDQGTLQCWILDNVAGGTANIVATTAEAGSEQGAAMFATEVQGLQNPSLDAAWSNVGADANPTVTASAPTAQANEILLAAVGDDGQNGQALGTWGNGFTQGQSNGSAGGFADCSINEGYRIVNGVGTFTADDTGRNLLDWAMILIALKGN